MRSGPGSARTILLFHIISASPSKQPLMVRTFLKVCMELGSYFLFLQEQIKDIIIITCECIQDTCELKTMVLVCLDFCGGFRAGVPEISRTRVRARDARTLSAPALVDGLSVLLEGGRQGRTTKNCHSSPTNCIWCRGY